MPKIHLAVVTFICLILLSCADHKLVNKAISREDVRATWYHESYISSTRDFVSLNLNGQNTIVLNCNSGMITDIGFSRDTLLIKCYRPSFIYAYKPGIEKFTVKIDSSINYNAWNKYYHPELYDKTKP
jgi:hypothetical protein